jgi:hypothetical protein
LTDKTRGAYEPVTGRFYPPQKKGGLGEGVLGVESGVPDSR